MADDKWIKRLERERSSRKQAEELLENKSLELWNINQTLEEKSMELAQLNHSLEEKVDKRTEELQLALVKMEEASKAKSQFLANMSHELRTPLNAIIGFSQILERNKELTEKPKLYISKINDSGSKLLQLINSILDFSKVEAGEVSLEKMEFNLYKVVQSVITQLELKAKEKNLEIIIEYGNNVDSKFNGDSLRLSQILTNLLTNAVKFTEHGSITILIAKSAEDRYRFEVKDTGIGLTPAQIEKLFKPFSQADSSTTRNYGGTGLGLSISKEFVELMNGKIWIESVYGVGTSFIFEIDLEFTNTFGVNDYVQKLVEEVHLADDIKHLGGKNILLVEDNITNQLVLTSILEDSALNIDIANNGQEAIVSFYSDNKYDLILMDLQMPILDGYEASKIIRSIDKKIPIIALSASVLRADIDKTFDYGMNAHLDKPIDINKLYETLLKYIS